MRQVGGGCVGRVAQARQDWRIGWMVGWWQDRAWRQNRGRADTSSAWAGTVGATPEGEGQGPPPLCPPIAAGQAVAWRRGRIVGGPKCGPEAMNHSFRQQGAGCQNSGRCSSAARRAACLQCGAPGIGDEAGIVNRVASEGERREEGRAAGSARVQAVSCAGRGSNTSRACHARQLKPL